MTPSARHFLQAAAALPAAAAVVCLALAARTCRLAVFDAAGTVPGAAARGGSASAAGGGTAPLAGIAPDLAAAMAPAAGGDGALSKRFRLAGTVLGARPEEALAILDDRTLVRQSVVSPGDDIVPGVVLVSVSDCSAVLSADTGEETLELEKVLPGPARGGIAPGAPADAAAPKSGDAPALTPRERAAARFGGREVFPGRWAYDRDKVVEYYEELRGQPERLLAIFDTMDPVWGEADDGARRIEGYRVAVKGEPDFFLAAGLEEGDVVVGVNSAPMNDRRRAEALIASFVEGRATTFVFEVERAGRRMRQVVEID